MHTFFTNLYVVKSLQSEDKYKEGGWIFDNICMFLEKLSSTPKIFIAFPYAPRFSLFPLMPLISYNH